MANEKRLIDANALKEQIEKEIHTYWTNGSGGYCLAEDVIPDIDNAPTVDAVEVVRCKECDYFVGDCDKYNSYCRLHAILVDEDDFCSYGEKREV